MQTEIPRAELEARYERSAQDYLRSLPLEHFMEATPQATQRSITLASFYLVKTRRPDIQLFNELLVQYPLPGDEEFGKVVPDNMVVVHPEPIEVVGSYNIPLQPVGPFWALEYVSESSNRRDYEEKLERYEQDLKVPYYLCYEPEVEKLILYKMVDDSYMSVRPNEHGRLAVPELEMEVGVKDGWVRFWFRGELLLLPDDLQQTLYETRRLLAEMTDVAESERQRADRERQLRLAAEVETARLRALLEQRQAPPGKS